MIIHNSIAGQRIQPISAWLDRASLFLQPICLQSIYLSSDYDQSNVFAEMRGAFALPRPFAIIGDYHSDSAG